MSFPCSEQPLRNNYGPSPAVGCYSHGGREGTAMYEAGVTSRGSRFSRSRQLAATSRQPGTCLRARGPA